MTSAAEIILPSAEHIRQAVRIFLGLAYGDDPPAKTAAFIPPQDCDVAQWLMSNLSERDPAKAELANVRSFALRVGCGHYPNMKLRISRTPLGREFMFSVDTHDAFLKVPHGSDDGDSLEQLKQANATIASDIRKAWDAAKLPTELAFLKRSVRQARSNRQST